MLCNGKANKFLVLLFVLGLSFRIEARFNQLMEAPAMESGLSKKQEVSPHVHGSRLEEIPEAKRGRGQRPYSAHVYKPTPSEEFSGQDQKSHVIQSGIQVMGDGLKERSYTDFPKRDQLRMVNRSGRTAYGIRYIHDQFDYNDSRGIFKMSYQDPSGSLQGGILLIGGERFFSRRFIDISGIANIGFGYNKGTGAFVDGTTSRARFQLWMLPVDIGLGIGIPVGSWFVLHASGGPSLMGLIQTRNDRARGSSEREKRQVSYGYFGEAKLRMNLSRFFTNTGFSVYRDYEASNFYLDFITRVHNYENFKDDLSISGQSFGIGFTFDFL